jgi:hypothetical protein
MVDIVWRTSQSTDTDEWIGEKLSNMLVRRVKKISDDVTRRQTLTDRFPATVGSETRRVGGGSMFVTRRSLTPNPQDGW